MAQLIIDIPDAVLTDVIESLCVKGGYRSQALDGTKASFARAQVRRFIRLTYQEWKVIEAKRAAEFTAATTAETDTSGITVT